jgi:hypothetical protein
MSSELSPHSTDEKLFKRRRILQIGTVGGLVLFETVVPTSLFLGLKSAYDELDRKKLEADLYTSGFEALQPGKQLDQQPQSLENFKQLNEKYSFADKNIAAKTGRVNPGFNSTPLPNASTAFEFTLSDSYSKILVATFGKIPGRYNLMNVKKYLRTESVGGEKIGSSISVMYLAS